jgi:hypothetical protein
LIKEISPLEVVLTLVRFGFTHDQILYELTAPQVRSYFELAVQKQEDEMKSLSIASRIAYHADEKQYDKYMKGQS